MAALTLIALVQRQGGPDNGDADSLISMATEADPSLENLFEPLRALDPDAAGVALGAALGIDEAERPRSFEWLLSRYGDQGRQVGFNEVGDVQTALLSALLAGEAGTVLDPCAGSGTFLLAATEAMRDASGLFAQEADHRVARIARQRCLVQELPVFVATGDSLDDDAWPDLRADFVVCNPPFQVRRTWPPGVGDDPRWAFGPLPETTDFAWLLHALHHLAIGGRAYVFLPPGSLFRSGVERELRGRLLAAGAVEAVVSLPAGSAPQTGIPIVLWVLRRPRPRAQPDRVLLIDPMAPAPVSRAEFGSDSVSRLAALLRRWREEGRISR